MQRLPVDSRADRRRKMATSDFGGNHVLSTVASFRRRCRMSARHSTQGFLSLTFSSRVRHRYPTDTDLRVLALHHSLG